MMKPFLQVFVWLLTFTSFCQERPFAAIAEDINATISYHDQLLFREMVSLKDFNLDYETIKNELGDDVIYSVGKDSVEVWPLREYYQAQIFRQLDELFAHKDISKHDVAGLLNMQVIKSDDNRLYNITMDENTGGSYHSRLSAVYYLPYKPAERRINDFFDTDGYSMIYTLNTGLGPKYLLLGDVVGCNSCFIEYILLMHFEKGKPVEDFKYRTEIRGWDETIVYDPAKRTLTINYMTSDLSPHCHCTDATENEGTNELTEWECSCTFAFNGETFELSGRESRKVKH